MSCAVTCVRGGSMLSERSLRSITRVALSLLGEDGFALAGSGAIREHRLISRETVDIDLFNDSMRLDAPAHPFRYYVDKLAQGLADAGMRVDEAQIRGDYARLCLHTDEGKVEVDLGFDYREFAPVDLSIGPVLDIRDAVGNKVCAVYSRGEIRDYIDLDSIRLKSEFSDDDFIALARERDAGFDDERFAEALSFASRIPKQRVAAYGLTENDLMLMQKRTLDWARSLCKGGHRNRHGLGRSV
ncbi:MAG: nucleotidyl transferase AbiEii/AbiGii toxin family protein [Coriobacteriaceae bacterium]|nr:nucleotidyl transferase AbiEii/AbiGii toxin family protein [Coriobacteriaceae bacterium]